MPTFIRYASFPLIEGGAVLLIVLLASQGVAYWPAFPMLVLAAVALLAVLERRRPYESAWNDDHDGDTRIDAMHLFLNQVLIQPSVALAYGLRDVFPLRVVLWPDAAPMWVQVLLAGAVIDLGLYAMHRYSHKSAFLWLLHKLHHSPERMYWMNGGRRHPVSALIMAAPSLSLLVLLGATPMAVAAWMAILSIHLCFQHSNLDYSLGPLRHVFCVAENHRWHHKRQFEDAQVNFGEVWAVWDHLFGTYFDATASPRAGEVGLIDTTVPPTYLGQLAWPFRKLITAKHVSSHRN